MKSIREKQARAFFVETGTIIPLKSSHIFTPERLQKSLENLTDELERKGFAQAKATSEITSSNQTSGAVSVRINLEEGKRSVVLLMKQQTLS